MEKKLYNLTSWVQKPLEKQAFLELLLAGPEHRQSDLHSCMCCSLLPGVTAIKLFFFITYTTEK
jgi:hypothetical protein